MEKSVKIAFFAIAALVSSLGSHAFACEPLAKPSAESAAADSAIKLPDSKLGYSRNYIHTWIYFPPFDAFDLKSGKSFSFVPEKGIANVIVFLASWCVPCQALIPEIKKLERTYSPIHTRFYYVFAHDTKNDAAGFINDYGLSNGLFADDSVLSRYNNPELPSIYVGDRQNCLSSRALTATSKDLEKLSQALRYMTAN